MGVIALSSSPAAAGPLSSERLATEAGVLLDEARPEAERLAAAASLGEQGVEALPFLLSAARLEGVEGGDSAVAVAAVEAMAEVSDPAVVQYAWAVLERPLEDEVRLAAVSTLVETGLPEAGVRLWEAATDRGLPRELRRAAAAAVEQSFPAVVAERGVPGAVSDRGGLAAGLAANAVTGGVVLSSIGVWGRSASAVNIGAVGGSVIGLGAGALYAAREPVSDGLGLRYASGVGWGLSYGLMGEAVLGTGGLGGKTSENLRALYRSLGVSGGAAAGLLMGHEDPAVGDVIEVDLAAYLGLQSGMSAGRMLSDTVCEEVPQGADCDWEDASRRVEQRIWRAGAAGLTAGLAAGALSRDRWELGWQDIGFGATAGVELGWIAGWLPTALRVDEPGGNTAFGLHAGAAAGLAAAHFVPGLAERTPLVAWGVITGNALGAGVPLLAGVEDEAVVSWLMLPSGAAAATAGGLLAPVMPLDGGDRAMVGVGTGLVGAEALAIAQVLDRRLPSADWDTGRSAGLVLSAGGAAGMGLTALGQVLAPETGDMLFLGSAAAWGSWFGALTPIGLGLEGDYADFLITTTAAGDAFLLLGGLALLPPVDLDPQRTLLAQLGGVGGATLGALGIAMISTDGNRVAMGAVVGSAVGLLGGGVASAALGGRELALAPPLPRLNLPGSWSVGLLPAPGEEGGLSWTLSLSASGL